MKTLTESDWLILWYIVVFVILYNIDRSIGKISDNSERIVKLLQQQRRERLYGNDKDSIK